MSRRPEYASAILQLPLVVRCCFRDQDGKRRWVSAGPKFHVEELGKEVSCEDRGGRGGPPAEGLPQCFCCASGAGGRRPQLQQRDRPAWHARRLACGALGDPKRLRLMNSARRGKRVSDDAVLSAALCAAARLVLPGVRPGDDACRSPSPGRPQGLLRPVHHARRRSLPPCACNRPPRPREHPILM